MTVTERALAVPASKKRLDSDVLEDHALLLSHYPINFTLVRLDCWNNSPGITNDLETAGRSQRQRCGLRCEVNGGEAQVATGGCSQCRRGRLAFPAAPAPRWGLEPGLPSRAGAGPGPEVTCRDRGQGEAAVVAQAGWSCDQGRRRGDGGGDSVPGLGVRPR